MKINQISQLNTTNFNAGKTTVFSDFDGSYMPFRHIDICKGRILSQSNKKDSFNKLFKGYADFLKKAKQDIELVITTGRSKLEYDYFINKAKEFGLFYQPPSKLITRDGNDYYSIRNDSYEINETRQQNIEKQTNWNKQKIKDDLKNILNSNFKDICIINSPINKNEYDYEDLSLEQNLKNLTNKEKMYYVSFTEGDNLLLEVAFSEKLDSSKIKQLFERYIKDNGIQAEINMYEEDNNTYLPQYDSDNNFKLKPGKFIRITPKIDNEKITKINDVKQELEFNIKNKTDNLVVAIGDSSNDEIMLNPLNYLSIYGYKPEKGYSKILNNQEILNLIAQMPFAAIIVGENSSLDNIRQLGTELEQRGIKKIYTCKDSEKGFLPQLKRAISDYGKQNEEFKYSMNTLLFEEVLAGGYQYDC